MKLGREIQNDQNDVAMLKCLYASKVYFNRAEVRNCLFLLIGILSALCVFIPDKVRISAFIPYIFDILAGMLWLEVVFNVKNGSNLRNYFDYRVLGIDSNKYTEDQIEQINEKIYAIVKKNSSNYKKQINNTGFDVPPGVRNWYVLDESKLDIDAVSDCQKQNCWWTKKMMLSRYGISVAVLAAFILFTVFCIFFFDLSTIKILSYGVALLIFFARSIIANAKYTMLSIKIQGVLDLFDKTLATQDQIYYFQTLINQRREIAVLEMNWLHNKHNKTFSEKYMYRISNHLD